MATMNKHNPRWQEFVDRLEGPEGCNFTGKTPKTFRWECDSTITRPKATAIMTEMGLTPEEISESLVEFRRFGGHCDCEILFNCDD